MKPEMKGLVAAACASLLGVISCIGNLDTGFTGLEIAGTTVNGMAFRGRLSGLHGGKLTLNTAGAGRAAQLGIPLSSLAGLSLAGNPVPGAVPANAIEPICQLMPHWDRPTLLLLVALPEQLGEANRWHLAWKLSSGLAKSAVDPEIRRKAEILKAATLMEMGLYHELREILPAINGLYPPLESPARLCLLNARLLEREGRLAEAAFWSGIPSLRIPSTPDAATTACRTLYERLMQTHTDLIPELKTPS